MTDPKTATAVMSEAIQASAPQHKLRGMLRIGTLDCWMSVDSEEICLGTMIRTERGDYAEINGYGESFDEAYSDLRSKIRDAC